MEKKEQAIILAAGEGQRLRPFTALKPKVMISIANKPILQYVVEALAHNGIRNIVMVVGYRKEHVLDFFGSGDRFDVEIDYIVQSQQLGTAHALKQAKAQAYDSFLVLSGDNIVEPDTIADLVKAEPNAVLIKEQENVSKYGVVIVKDGTVTDIMEKPERAISHLVNTGLYVFAKEIFDLIGEENDLPAIIRNTISLGRPIKTVETSGTWLDVVYPWDILKLNDLALGKRSSSLGGTIERGTIIKGPVSVGKGTLIRSNSYIVGPATIGENCEIGPSVCILPSTSIGDNVCIHAFTEIKNSIIGESVEIGASSLVEDSIIDRGCTVKGHFIARSGETEIKIDGEHHRVTIGTMIGEQCTIEENVAIVPGVMIGNRSQIRAFKLIRESIPDEGFVV